MAERACDPSASERASERDEGMNDVENERARDDGWMGLTIELLARDDIVNRTSVARRTRAREGSEPTGEVEGRDAGANERDEVDVVDGILGLVGVVRAKVSERTARE